MFRIYGMMRNYEQKHSLLNECWIHNVYERIEERMFCHIELFSFFLEATWKKSSNEKRLYELHQYPKWK